MKQSREHRDMAEARERLGRALKYAKKFPRLSRESDPWCSLEWQLDLVSRYNERAAQQK
jgi:hypothetical protein